MPQLVAVQRADELLATSARAPQNISGVMLLWPAEHHGARVPPALAGLFHWAARSDNLSLGTAPPGAARSPAPSGTSNRGSLPCAGPHRGEQNDAPVGLRYEPRPTTGAGAG